MPLIDLYAESAKGVHAELSWLLYTVMGLFVLTIIVGWLTSAEKPGQVEAAPQLPDPVAEQESAVRQLETKAPVKKKALKAK